MQEFEEGKQLIVEGLEEYIRPYYAFSKIVKGMKMAGVNPDSFESSGMGQRISLLEVLLQTFINDLKAANNPDELQEAFRYHQRAMDMILGKKEDSR